MTEIKIRRRLKEIEALRKHIEEDRKPEPQFKLTDRPLPEGISVVIPVYKGEAYMERLVASIEQQSLEKEKFEVIIIFNGDYEESEAVFNSLDKSAKYHVLYEDHGVGKARNAGIRKASFYCTAFLDADDTISPDYLKNSLSECGLHTILLNQLYDVKGEKVDASNFMNNELVDLKIYPNDYYQVVKNLSLNGAKVLPTRLLKRTMFEESLNNGEDVVIYMQLLSDAKPIIKINPKEAIYYRHIVENSLSRSEPTYQFNIIDRVKVLKKLQDILKVEDDEEVRTVVIDRMRAQAGFINRYLKKNPEDYMQVIGEVEHLTDEYFPYQRINEDLPKRLYISYCFPPYTDTSGIVLAKRIAREKQPCDLVQNNMYDVRSLDLTLDRIADPYIEKRLDINATSSFSNSKYINTFVSAAMRQLDITKYKEIYSRAMWPASHILAFEIYKRDNNIKWIAEFSDPLLKDIKNEERFEPYFNKKEQKAMLKFIPDQYHKYVDNNLFNMAEVLPFILAETLVFTNTLQLEAMIERFDDDFKAMVKEKAEISRHPTLDEKYYSYQKHYVDLMEDKVNIGYFGNFYETRNADELMNIAEIIKKEQLDARLYIFTNNPRQVKNEMSRYGLKGFVYVYPYLRYFEFLSVSKDFDYLLLNDAYTKEYKQINPYLPSKFSDYAGAGTNIWIQYEVGSILHQISEEAGTDIIANELNDSDAIKENLLRIMQKYRAGKNGL